MKILVVCHQGNNRSVTVANQLRYWKHDVLTAGLEVNPKETLDLLCDWSDRILVVEFGMERQLDKRHRDKVEVWHVGPDEYPRPFNKELLARVTALMEAHKAEYKPIQWTTLRGVRIPMEPCFPTEGVPYG